jgi:hypothetical protein
MGRSHYLTLTRISKYLAYNNYNVSIILLEGSDLISTLKSVRNINILEVPDATEKDFNDLITAQMIDY